MSTVIIIKPKDRYRNHLAYKLNKWNYQIRKVNFTSLIRMQ